MWMLYTLYPIAVLIPPPFVIVNSIYVCSIATELEIHLPPPTTQKVVNLRIKNKLVPE